MKHEFRFDYLSFQQFLWHKVNCCFKRKKVDFPSKSALSMLHSLFLIEKRRQVMITVILEMIPNKLLEMKKNKVKIEIAR